MDKEPRSLLIEIVDTYTLDVINDRVRLENLLSDIFKARYKKEKNTLIASLDEGIPGDLIKTHTSIPVPILISQLGKRLIENRGISEDLATWAVTTWALALRIPVEIDHAAPPEENATITLTVKSSPPGAEVYVNSYHIGTAPVTVSAIPAGSNHIQCVLDGYDEWKKAFDFGADTPSYSITATLTRIEPEKAWLFTASNPPGALIYLNGKLLGNTPLSIPDLPPSRYGIRFSLHGYDDWESTLSLSSGQRKSVHANLVKQQGAGTLGVQSQPPGAACYLDDHYQSTVPVVLNGVAAGRHKVRCSFKGYHDITQTVDLAPGQRKDLTFTFSPARPAMACDYCGRVQQLPFTCIRCGGQFCTDHRLPEYHRCSGRSAKPSPSRQKSRQRSPGSSRPSPQQRSGTTHSDRLRNGPPTRRPDSTPLSRTERERAKRVRQAALLAIVFVVVVLVLALAYLPAG